MYKCIVYVEIEIISGFSFIQDFLSDLKQLKRLHKTDR